MRSAGKPYNREHYFGGDYLRRANGQALVLWAVSVQFDQLSIIPKVIEFARKLVYNHFTEVLCQANKT